MPTAKARICLLYTSVLREIVGLGRMPDLHGLKPNLFVVVILDIIQHLLGKRKARVLCQMIIRIGVLETVSYTHLVETSAGTFSYGKCIYAMGAHNFIPPFPGKDLSGVYSIRTDKDMNAIRRGSLLASHAVAVSYTHLDVYKRQVVMSEGRKAGELSKEEFNQERILNMASGE